MTLSTRRLVGGDEAAFAAIRLAGLLSDPDAFGSSYDEESQWPAERYEQMLANNHVIGVFETSQLVATGAFYGLKGSMAHRGYIWGILVKQDQRGRGLGHHLMASMLDHGRDHVRQVHLTVGAPNTKALRLYEKVGFQIYGTEPRSRFVNGRYIDEHLMVRFFDEAPGKQTLND